MRLAGELSRHDNEDNLASADSPDDWARRLEHAVVRRAPKDSDNYSILCVWLAAVPAARGLPDEEVTIIKA